ncbi:O-antigen ligase family protein [Aquabacterium sp. A3]|uniref:O-antigen ligase family protein n=1 Tax=Aquabacterium sp. A3 TaxID=3132829 RepID=UPI0031192537
MNTKVYVNQDHRAGADSLMGLVFGFALLSFSVTMVWIVTDFGVPLLQLPVILLTLLAVVVAGFLYFLNPARFLTFFLIGLVYFSFEATVRLGGGGGGDLQSLVKGVFTLALAMLGIFTGLRSIWKSWISLAFFAYALFAMVSATYSPMVLIAGVAGIALVGVAIIAAKIGQGDQADVEDYWRAMYWASTLTVLASFAFMAISPNLARDFQDMANYRLRGITGTANSLGPIMGVACIMAFYMMKRSTSPGWWRFHVVMLLLFSAALLLTNSRSSILGVAVAFIASGFVGGGWGILRFLASLIGATILATVMFYPGLQDQLLSMAAALFSRTGSVHELTTFTGRQIIWAASWRLVEDSPWIGYGLSSVSVVLPKAHADQWGNTVATAHNSLLESLLSVGWLGTLPLLAVVLACLWVLARYLFASYSLRDESDSVVARRAMSVCAFRVLIMMLVQGVGEKAFAGHPGSPFVALGAVVATAVFMTLNMPRSVAWGASIGGKS